MIERDIELTLHELARVHVRHEAPADVREDARLVPLTTPRRRSWPPQPADWRFHSILSAARFVLAGAIVALFGGFLLAGILAQRNEDMAPAAVTDGPSPTTTEALLSGMVTEEVEPGVFRVLSDGVREPLALDSQAKVVAGMDGSVVLWHTDRRCHPPHALELRASCTGYRLGDPETFSISGATEPEQDPGGDLKPVGFGLHEVGPDGTIWGYSFIQGDGRNDLRAFDGDSLVVRKERGDYPSEVEPGFAADGTTWAVWSDGGDVKVGRLTAEGWEVVQGSEAGGAGWVIGSATGKVVLIRVGEGIMRATTEGLAPSYDAIEAPLLHVRRRPAGVADDGTLWWAGVRGFERPRDLVRFDGSIWQTFEIPVVARMGPLGTTVAPDGSVWVGSGAYDERGSGLHRFDGTAWTRFLPQFTIFSLDIGPDGAVWFIANVEPGDNRDHAGLYVITPEAVLATD